VLRCLMGEQLAHFIHWIDYLPLVEKLLNERPDKSRGGFSAKELFLGMAPDEPVHIALNSSSLPRAKDVAEIVQSDVFKQHMDRLAEQLKCHHAICEEVYLRKRNQMIRLRAGKHGVRPANFVLGDYVLVAHVDYKKDKIHKLQAQWKGPFVVQKVVNDFVYDVQDLRSYPSAGKITTHHAIRLRKYATQHEVPMSERLRQQAEYSISMFQVSAILDHRYNEAARRYDVHIKWLGLTNTENSWNPLSVIYAHAPHETELYLSKLSPTTQAILRKSLSPSS
jgi:hypothetical protein